MYGFEKFFKNKKWSAFLKNVFDKVNAIMFSHKPHHLDINVDILRNKN